MSMNVKRIFCFLKAADKTLIIFCKKRCDDSVLRHHEFVFTDFIDYNDRCENIK